MAVQVHPTRVARDAEGGLDISADIEILKSGVYHTLARVVQDASDLKERLKSM